MSHYWGIECEKCNEESEDHNKAKDELIRAVKSASSLFDVYKSGAWDTTDLKTADRYLTGVSGFLIDHFECGSFVVASEYGMDRIKVEPSDPLRERVAYLESRVMELREDVRKARQR